MAEKGRKGPKKRFIDDIPQSGALQAVLLKQDEILDQIKALTAKMDADFADVTNASTDYAASISDSLDKVQLS